MTRPLLIAEIGCNHKGEMAIAEEMVETVARFCKADAVKFQKRNSRELLTEEEYNAPHPNPINAYGPTYGAHREFLEFDLAQHEKLKDLCDRLGILYGTSVWDVTSAREIARLDPAIVKIPSGTNTNFGLLEAVCADYRGEIHISLGMTTRAEEEAIVAFLTEAGRAADTVLYSCTSGYPVAFDDLCLLEITRLRETYGSVVKSIGFSGHHLGIAADIAAATLGASHIERHFTLDRTWKGTDHSASLEPDGLRRLARDLHAVTEALQYKPTEILPVEEPQRAKLKWKGTS